MQICFLGGGNMAAALIGGLLDRGVAASAVQVVELEATARERLAQRHGVAVSDAPLPAAVGAQALVLAVKPQQMKHALAPLAGQLNPACLVISIAAGLHLADLRRWLGGHEQLVRAMPNTPALIGAGVTGLYAPAHVAPAGRELAERILGAVGSTVWVQDEAALDAVTAVSGSGPAYFFYFIESLIEAGVRQGLAPQIARQLALDTALGAARLAAGSDEPVSQLRERVTSKGGTTAAALASMTAAGVGSAISDAVAAACARSRELGIELGKD